MRTGERVSSVEGHRLWATVYDTVPNPLLSLECRVVNRLAGPVDGLRVIDVACGTGRSTARLRDSGADIYGIDLSPEMLSVAARKPALQNRLALASADALPFSSRSAALVLSSFAAGYFSDLSCAFAELARILQPGGSLILSDLHPDAIAAGWTRSFRSGDTIYQIEHFHRSTVDLLAAASATGLTLVTEQSHCFGVPEEAIFQAAGKPELFRTLSAIPALWIALWTRG